MPESENYAAQVSAKVRANLKVFRTPVEMPGGWKFDHVGTLKRIELYYNGQFASGKKDSDGSVKFFLNIVKPSCDVAEKFIDLDTKDFVCTTEKTGMDHKLWFYQRELRYWMKKNGFASRVNEFGHRYPKYGHIVAKKTADNDRKAVVIHNLRMDPSAPTLKDSPFVYEVLPMTRSQLVGMNKVWKSEAVEALLASSKEPAFIVYECYHREDGGKWARCFLTDVTCVKGKKGSVIRTPESQINDNGEYVPGTVLYEDAVDEEDFPYREKKWEDVPGRWLGMGFPEYLFDNQVSKNENANMRKKALYLESLHLFQTSDEMATSRNLLTDAKNGQVLVSREPINPIATEARNLPAHNVDDAVWDKNSEQKTFSFDIARGDDMPSGTPLGIAQLSAGMVASYFDKKKEELGLFFREMILEDIIPSFQKDRAKSHILKFFGTDKEIGKVRAAFEGHVLRKAVLDYASRWGVVPSQKLLDLERTRLRLMLKKRKDIDITIPDGFYDDVDVDIDVVVTGEQVDVRARQQTLTTVLTTVAGNPAIIKDPTTRAVFFKMLELAGLSPVDLDLIEDQAQDGDAMAMEAQQAPSGGPMPPPGPPQPVPARAPVAQAA